MTPGIGRGRWRASGAAAGVGLSVMLVCVPAGRVAAQGFPAWVGLYGADQAGWLENENRLAELCPDGVRVDRCRDEQLRPRVRVLTLRAAPEVDADLVGELIVTAVPGRGLAAAFRAADASGAVGFTPDLYLQDWGYGPLFHQTFSSRRGDWFELPADPWPGPVWFHDPDADAQGRIRDVQEGDILEWRGRGWAVVGVEHDAMTLRPEQPADMWCREGDPPPVEPTAPARVTRTELLDARGHLTVTIRYPKGC